MKITREELQAIENHISNIPHVGGMYAPVLIAWCRALLDEQDAATRERDEARAQLAALAPKVFITQLERGEIRHVAYVAGGFYAREAIAEWAKKELGFERAAEVRRLTIPDHKQFPPVDVSDDTNPKQKLTIELWDDGEDGTVATCAEIPGPIGEGTGMLEAITQLIFKLRWERNP